MLVGADHVLGFHHIEQYVGNADQAARFYSSTFGLPLSEGSSPDTARDVTSVVITLGDVEMILSAAVKSGPVADHVHAHGDGIKDLALSVSDLESAFERAVKAGATPLEEPREVTHGTRRMRRATVGTLCDLVHSLIEVNVSDAGRAVPTDSGAGKSGILTVDHLALAVEQGTLAAWRAFYESAFAFTVTHEETTATQRSAMRSVVLQNAIGTVKLTILEPAEGPRRSQIQDFLTHHNGAGVQHLALRCGDIVRSVAEFRARGLEFLNVPDSYYEMLPGRIGARVPAIRELQHAHVLLDRDEWGELLQTFSKPVTGRPTMFIELVERNGAKGFGSGNIRALFEAMEREQSAQTGW